MDDARRQPLLHDALLTFRSPLQAWSRPDGSMAAGGIDGIYHSDVRVVESLRYVVAGTEGESISTALLGAGESVSTSLLRGPDLGDGADPDVVLAVRRTTDARATRIALEVTSRSDEELRLPIAVRLVAVADPMDDVKSGAPSTPQRVAAEGATASWSGAGVEAHLRAEGAALAAAGSELVLTWALSVPARGTASAAFEVSASDPAAVVEAAAGTASWSAPDGVADDRLRRWIDRALDDLDGLRMRRPGSEDEFLAAGAPWFFTMFGRDSIWAARLAMPVDRGLALAGGTLRTLAALQGTRVDVETAEQPGKIPHELRRAAVTSEREGFLLPPLYYGTIDATPLWITLLHESWRAGLPDAEVDALLPNLTRALDWMREHGDSDGDGLLEYVDESGHGLANQGWKDSGDSVQWRDGRLADGPLALCEVQAYAHEAALKGAELLDAAGLDGGADWRDWASRLRERFAAAFWVSDAEGRFPAIALDGEKHAVDSLTSNIGHLLGTGILDAEGAGLVAGRLVSPKLSSGYGLRTLSSTDAGYWPLGYHVGSVWTHDTAIAIRGLVADGFDAEARILAEGLLAAAPAFDYRMPELHSGAPASETPVPIPYPAACRPQAWSAAAAIAVADALRA